MSTPAESSVYTATFLVSQSSNFFPRVGCLMWSLVSLTNSIAAILNCFGDFVELFVLKNEKVCAIGFQEKKNLYVMLFLRRAVLME